VGLNKTNDSRFSLIMSRVDEWAEENAGWNCRAEAEAEVRYILDLPYDAAQMSDEEIADCAIAAWMMAE
jgi:hypothetical protein